ncbi:MAG TPA: MaoC/PaaZ C-terminal domain-containing protein [Pseudogracilibacillus sp.]|nr:MaoC/PaaZ C-terminal domain-containing protein [Pseudogracilibacillus sp.]
MKFSDFAIGDVFTTNKVMMEEEEIIQFAKQYDPQYFHVNKSAAEASPYRSLIASGFHTISVVWAEWIKMDILSEDCLGGISAQMEWTKPVMPEDELYGKMTVLEKKESNRGERGLITFELKVFNQKEACVSKCEMKVFVAN